MVNVAIDLTDRKSPLTAPKPTTSKWFAVLATGCALATITACGSSSSGGAPHALPRDTPTPSTSPSTSVVVGSTAVQQSTLATGTNAFQPGKGLTQTAKGLTIAVAANRQAEAINASSEGLTSSLEIGVMVTPPTAPGLFYGLGCEGDFADFGDQYSGVTDSAGNWQLTSQQGGKITILKSGKAVLAAGDTQLNLACVELPDKAHTTRLSFALDGTIVGGIDDTNPKISTGNGFQLVLADPGTGTAGTAIFHHLEVRSASATS